MSILRLSSLIAISFALLAGCATTETASTNGNANANGNGAEAKQRCEVKTGSNLCKRD